MMYLMKAGNGAHAVLVSASSVEKATQKLKDEGYRIVGKLTRVPDFIVSLRRVAPASKGFCPNYKVVAGGSLGLWLNSEHRIEFV